MPRPLLYVMLLALAGSMACRTAERRPSAPAAVPQAAHDRGPKPRLRLIAVTDMNGYLEPCGCQSVPLGGIDKAAAEMDRLAQDGAPALLVSVGNLFFEPAGGNHGTSHDDPGEADASTQQKWQAETLAGVLARMQLAAAAPGPADLNHGPETLAKLAKISGAPLLAAGATKPPEGLPLSATRIVERGKLKIGLFGLSDFGGEAAPTLPEDPIAEAKKRTAELRASGADLVVGLLSADARTARRLAGAVEGLDFLVLGGLDSADFPPPERIGDTTLLRSGHRGHGLLVVDIFTGKAPGKGGYADVSKWTREVRRDGLSDEAAALEKRIAAWEKEGQDPKLIAEQRARLDAMKQEMGALAKVPKPEGNAFSARFVKLDPDVSGAATVRVLLEEHDKRVNEHNRTALANVAPPPVPKGAAGYVGSEACGGCHAPAMEWWQNHAHGNAYATLEERNKQFNLSCVGCHVTGYNRPGGATVVQNEGLTNVGCESCHGPGSKHVEDRKAPAAVNVTRVVPEPTCKQCHVPEHSDRFQYDAYKAMLMVPGHGLPLKQGG